MKLIYYPPPHTHNTTQHTLTHTDTYHHRHQLHFSRTRGKSTIIDNLCLFIYLIFCLFFAHEGCFGVYRLVVVLLLARGLLSFPYLHHHLVCPLNDISACTHPPLLLLLRLLFFGFLSPECVKINMLAAVCAPAIPSLFFLSFSLFSYFSFY